MPGNVSRFTVRLMALAALAVLAPSGPARGQDLKQLIIDKHFASGNGAACLKSLESVTGGEESDWATRTAAELRERSPLSVDVSLELIDRAKTSSMAETLARSAGL